MGDLDLKGESAIDKLCRSVCLGGRRSGARQLKNHLLGEVGSEVERSRRKEAVAPAIVSEGINLDEKDSLQRT